MKKLLLIGETIALSLIAAFMVQAGTWKKDATGWWYDYGNGTFPAASWQWIDGNNDGIAECYYFNQNGYIAVNTVQDGCMLNADGQWVNNGVVQTKNVGITSNASNQQSGKSAGNTQSASDSEKTSASDTDKSETSGFNMWDMKPTDYRLFSKDKNVTTNQQKVWGKAFCLSLQYSLGIYNDSFAEFYIGGEYNTLTFTAAPDATRYKKGFILRVLGDDDEELGVYEFNRKSKPTTETVDVSGHEYIKFYFGLDESDVDNSDAYVSLYLKNVNLS